jgi:Zn-dependent protease with chaperone function
VEATVRNRPLLAGLGAIGFGNGFLLALSLYGLLAAFLHIFGTAPPPFWLAVVAGVLAGSGVIGSAALRQWGLAQAGYSPWASPAPTGIDVGAWDAAAAEIAGRAGLGDPPRVKFAAALAPNAFAVEPAQLEPAVIVTDGLAAGLSPTQQYAVLAHEIAHLEAGDLREVGFAEAIWQTVNELGDVKGRFLWGPKQILISLLPVIVLGLIGILLRPLIPENSRNAGLGEILLGLGIAILLLYWLLVLLGAAIGSWRGFLQLFVYCTFFGPLTLAEAALAWPTMFALARLFSRQRVYAADARAVELTHEPEALIGALEAVETVERSAAEEPLGQLRFGLFATPPASSWYRALVERVTGTHPPAARRIARIRERSAQERSRGEASGSEQADSLEQSG